MKRDKSKPIIVCEKPCASCPYRKDVPAGIWHESEYQKLPEYDDGCQIKMDGERIVDAKMPALGMFLCHYSPSMEHDALCRGWLSVHADSIAVRLLLMQQIVTPEQVYAEPLVELYASGREACDAGMAGIDNPSRAAIRQIDKLESRVPKTGYERKTRDGKSGKHYDTHPKSKKSKRHKRASK